MTFTLTPYFSLLKTPLPLSSSRDQIRCSTRLVCKMLSVALNSFLPYACTLTPSDVKRLSEPSVLSQQHQPHDHMSAIRFRIRFRILPKDTWTRKKTKTKKHTSKRLPEATKSNGQEPRHTSLAFLSTAWLETRRFSSIFYPLIKQHQSQRLPKAAKLIVSNHD